MSYLLLEDGGKLLLSGQSGALLLEIGQLVNSLGGSVGLRPYMDGLAGQHEYLVGQVALRPYNEGETGEH